ncbi:unnamed protein product, partial [marine sediment metagenome]
MLRPDPFNFSFNFFEDQERWAIKNNLTDKTEVP